jgi:hypothetical protein
MIDERPPITVLDFELPFLSERFDDRDFEHLCADLFQAETGLRFLRYGRKGDQQHGIDILSQVAEPLHRAVQCKRVKEFRPSDLRNELAKLSGLPIKLSHLYFAVTCDVSSDVINECAAKAGVVTTAAGPVQNVELWDRSFLGRLLRRYPNLVGSYFGVQWRDHLFPNLAESEIRNSLPEIRRAVEDIKRRLSISNQDQLHPTMVDTSGKVPDALSTRLIHGVEGYFRDDQGIVQFRGDVPHTKCFSFKYSAQCGLDGQEAIITMLSATLSPEEAIDLEAVLEMDTQKPASRSTYWSHDILLTHISGPAPMISLPNRGISFSLAFDSDYKKLKSMVGRFLDNFSDSAVAARRERVLQSIVGGIPETRALLLRFKYSD